MTHEEILKRVEDRSLNLEQAFQELSSIGYCPNLINDDDGRWAVAFDGIQDVVTGDNAEDINTSFFIEAKQWSPSITEALIIALTEDK